MNVDGITITLTLLEAHAIYQALGRMAPNDYLSEAEGVAGSTVYDELTPYVDDEE